MYKVPFKVDLSKKVIAITGAGGIICGEFARAAELDAFLALKAFPRPLRSTQKRQFNRMTAARTAIMYPRIRTISSGRGNRVIDFDAAWRHLQQTTKAPDDCQRWNKKAARYDSRDAKNLYAEAFVELAGVQPGETIFD